MFISQILMLSYAISFSFFFFNDTPTTEIYTLSLHDALPIFTGHKTDPHEARWLAHGLRHGMIRPSCIPPRARSEEHTSELQSHSDLVCRLLLEKKKNKRANRRSGHRIKAKHKRKDVEPPDPL